jgi:DNA-binding MarR family transcriptional regulator
MLGIIELLFSASHKLAALENIPRDFGVHEKLTRAEIHMLAAIEHSQDASVTDLARIKGITKGAVSQLLKRLEAKKLVEKTADESNVSRLKVRLTAAGRKACRGHERMHETILETVEARMGTLDPEEIAIFERTLVRVNDLLDHMMRMAM